MPIDFHDNNNKKTYTDRSAHGDWKEHIEKMIDGKKFKRAADIGCGGGIYSKALVELGIPKVTGIDFSRSMIEGALENTSDYNNSRLNFELGSAYETDLPSEHVDLVLERALIHHLEDLSNSMKEAYRILRDKGVLIIQDRTPSDCFLEGSESHIRGYIFSLFPHLKEVEEKRRYESEVVKSELKDAGFLKIMDTKIWETRMKYRSKSELFNELRLRKGRSILFELNDNEIEELITYIDRKIIRQEIIDKDRWTVWSAVKLKSF